MLFSIVTLGDLESITVMIDGELKVATSTHPNYQAIKAGAKAGDTSIASLFDVIETVKSAFGEVTDRVTVTAEGVWLDGEPVHGSITKVLMSLVGQGERDGYIGLARFLERLQDNPSHRSREQLFNFVQHNDITIDSEGHLVLYKSVQPDGKGGYQSISRGTAWVNGVEHTGNIPANVGDVVTMPRNLISDDPNVACHVGLHAGAREYASWFGGGQYILQVLVGPEHVVSVPADSSHQKIRTEQYTIGSINGSTMPAYLSNGLTSYYEDEEDYEEDYEDDDDYGDYDVDDEPTVWPNYNVSFNWNPRDGYGAGWL